DAGLVIIDIEDVENPRVISRVNNIGYVYDIAVNGNTAYVALGSRGILTVDVTDPSKPMRMGGFENYGNSFVQVVEATAYSAIGGGSNSTGGSVIQETPDIVLKLHSIDPSNRILDRNADGTLTVRLRFNKAIDLTPNNEQYFYALNSSGQLLKTNVKIVNNDALITFEEPLLSSAGDQIKIVIEAGLTAVKPLEGSNHLTLFKLQSEQHIDLVYRGLRPESPRINAVMPRRIPSGQPASITVSMIGIPVVKEKIKLFLGSKPLTVTSVERSQDDSRIGIVKAQVPAIAAAGLYDLLAHVEFNGVSEAVTLYGALQVDAPIVFSSIEPRWGPMSGGTVITVHGE